MGKRSKILLACSLVTTFAVAGTSAVSAGSSARAVTIPASVCPTYDLAQPFLPWLDPMYYMLAPNGGFESGSDGWALSGAAGVVNGNETYQVGGASDTHSLFLPSSSSATTSSMCVGILDPTVRLFAVSEGSSLSKLKVEALYIDAFGNRRAATVALLSGTRTWRPTLPLAFRAQLANPPLVTDGTTSVAFRFTPSGINGRWKIDDIYVDPFKGR
jgi:hypothetical protein